MTDRVAEPTPSPLAIEMIDVTVAALKDPENLVLEGVNWSVAVGDYWMIGGLQGSGKSDFMALAAGIMPPARGSCRVFGRELFSGFDQELLATRLRLGLVFDGGHLLHHLTVRENVELPLRYHHGDTIKEIAEQVEAMLELTGLTSRADESPDRISRNWQQRAGLARALALKPELLLLDNPLTGLDPPDAAWWLEVLRQLAAGHPVMNGQLMTVVVTGDDLRPWKDHAQQFAILKDKNFIVLGKRPDLARHPEPLLQELLRAAPPGGMV